MVFYYNFRELTSIKKKENHHKIQFFFMFYCRYSNKSPQFICIQINKFYLMYYFTSRTNVVSVSPWKHNFYKSPVINEPSKYSLVVRNQKTFIVSYALIHIRDKEEFLAPWAFAKYL